MPLFLPPTALDLRQLAREGGALAGQAPAAAFERLTEGGTAEGGLLVRWTASAEWRPVVGGADQLWLRLTADGHVPQVCQRCLSPFWQPVALERWFRFVADEATAEAQDEDSEEDVLAFVPRFDLQSLVEDELLLALPLVPMHEPDCPEPVQLTAGDLPEAAEPKKQNPFAALATLKTKREP